MRLIVQLDALSANFARIRDAHPNVEIIEFTGGDPPPGLRADAFFGGYVAWDQVIRWLDSAEVGWVQLPGTGIDNAPDALFERNRIVTCARGACAVPISEWVLAAVLAWAKRMPETFLTEPPPAWTIANPALDALDGSTLALIGLGGIGEAIAARAKAFGMHVRALRRRNVPSSIEGVEIVSSLSELLLGAQHVVLAVPATARTRGLIDADAFAFMTPGVHLVNIARGALVDQDALRVALDTGTVAMATLDTVEPEPLPSGHWLYEHPKVRLTAHISCSSSQFQVTAVEILNDNIDRFLRGQPLLHEVDRVEGY